MGASTTAAEHPQPGTKKMLPRTGVQSQGLRYRAHSPPPGSGPTVGKRHWVRRRRPPAGGGWRPLNEPAAPPLPAEPQTDGGEHPPQYAAVPADRSHLFHSSTSFQDSFQQLPGPAAPRPISAAPPPGSGHASRRRSPQGEQLPALPGSRPSVRPATAQAPTAISARPAIFPRSTPKPPERIPSPRSSMGTSSSTAYSVEDTVRRWPVRPRP